MFVSRGCFLGLFSRLPDMDAKNATAIGALEGLSGARQCAPPVAWTGSLLWNPGALEPWSPPEPPKLEPEGRFAGDCRLPAPAMTLRAGIDENSNTSEQQPHAKGRRARGRARPDVFWWCAQGLASVTRPADPSKASPNSRVRAPTASDLVLLETRSREIAVLAVCYRCGMARWVMAMAAMTAMVAVAATAAMAGCAGWPAMPWIAFISGHG